VLLKPSAGGGGKGMHVVRSADAFAEELARARREATAAFGDERMVLERYLEHPRHVEVQLLLDEHGGALHLGERDCSLQRRHQKVIEEAPSPAVDAGLRSRLASAAISLAQAAGYVGAGTAEFLLDEAGDFFFLELNARLQVEHPVTEAITGRDLVADQLRIATGEPLGFAQDDVAITGHAIEARLYAEDPWNEFLPSVGGVGDPKWPSGPGIRVDAGVGPGDQVGTRYDPLLAKIIVYGRDREEARLGLMEALDETSVSLTTNVGFLRTLLERPEFVRGEATTSTIDSVWQPDPATPEDAWQKAADLIGAPDRSSSTLGFRLNAPRSLALRIGDEERRIEAGPARAGGPTGPEVDVEVDGRYFRAILAPAPTVDEAVRHAARESTEARAVQAPMPGTVLAVKVAEGDQVDHGQPLVVLEAMKMENAVTAPSDGRVERILVAAGDQVQRGQALVELA
jgi:acetyl/propionyl-CoA carboxylase alpha subunit